MSNIKRAMQSALYKYAWDLSFGKPDDPNDAKVGTPAQAFLPLTDVIKQEDSTKDITVPETVAGLKAMGDDKVKKIRMVPNVILKKYVPTYASQRALNAALYIHDNKDNLGKMFGNSVGDAFSNFVNRAGMPLLLSAVNTISPAVGSGVGAAAGATSGAPVRPAKFGFGNDGKPTPESYKENAPTIDFLSRAYANASKGKFLTKQQLMEQRTNMAKQYTAELGIQPGDPNYNAWVNYFLERGAENYRKYLDKDIFGVSKLLEKPKSNVKFPASATPEQKTYAGLYGTLMADNNTRPAAGYPGGITT